MLLSKATVHVINTLNIAFCQQSFLSQVTPIAFKLLGRLDRLLAGNRTECAKGVVHHRVEVIGCPKVAEIVGIDFCKVVALLWIDIFPVYGDEVIAICMILHVSVSERMN